jgi:hypothetical protein
MTINEVTDSIAYCGLVCKFCHLANTCDGCKSENNCCGRHLSTGGCYQYNCCKERGLNGCWECKDFSCGKDMFSDSHDIRLRAFVRCVKEESLNKLAEYVLRNQQNGIYYGHNKDYDGLGSEEAVLRLLRTGQK